MYEVYLKDQLYQTKSLLQEVCQQCRVILLVLNQYIYQPKLSVCCIRVHDIVQSAGGEALRQDAIRKRGQ